jgi:hypothetical protein
MRFLFPLKLLVDLSRRNRLWTFGTFIFCIILAIVNGYLKGTRADPYVVTNFVQPWRGFSWDIFVEVLKFLYTPVGLMLKSLVAFILFLFLIYIFSGAKKTARFIDFILPFIGLSFLGITLRTLSIVLFFVSLSFPYLLVLCIVLYLLIFYCVILIREFKVNLFRSILAIIVSFFLVFIFSGFPGVAPYLAWI